MSEINERDFGRLEAEVEGVRDELRQHKDESRRALSEAKENLKVQGEKIDQLLALANKGRGAWWVALTLASSMGAFAGFFMDMLFRR